MIERTTETVIQPTASDAEWSYPQLPRTAAYRWWRSVVALLLLLVVGALCVAVLVGVVRVVMALSAVQQWQLRTEGSGLWWQVLLAHLALLTLIPAALAAAKWGFAYPVRWLWSAYAGFRWRWFGCCLLASAVCFGVLVVCDLESGFTTDTWQPESFAWGLLCIAVFLTPFQALAEELAFRGVFFQAVGALFRHKYAAFIVATLISSVCFALAHGDQTGWVFADRLLMGVLLCWLAFDTEGLEAPIALHIVNNQVTFVMAIATGGMADALLAQNVVWQSVVLHMTIVLLLTVVLSWWYRRRRVDATL